MNKKYMILKSKPVKAQFGEILNSTFVGKNRKQNMAIAKYGPDAFSARTEAQNALAGNEASAGLNSKIMGGLSMGTQIAQMGSDALFAKSDEKNSVTDGFGDEVFDQGDANRSMGKGAVDGALKGFQMGMASGNPFLAGGAALLGGLTGLAGGKKAGEAEMLAYNNNRQKKKDKFSRNTDMANTQALYGSVTAKTGTKLGSFTTPSKKLKPWF